MSRIKPLLHHQIVINSLYTYQNLLQRKPKKAPTFKFSAQEWEFGQSKNKHNQIQAKLLKALDLARPVRKVDLKHTELQKDLFGKSKLLLIFKRISKVKALSLVWQKDNGIEKSLRYFKEVQYLSYKFNGSMRKFSRRCRRRYLVNSDCKFPLKYLGYCLKLQKLLLGDDMRCYCFSFKELSHKFSSDIIRKNFMINHLHFERTLPHCSIPKYLNQIVSIHSSTKDGGPPKTDLNLIQALSSLQEISLNFKDSLSWNLPEILQKVAAKGVLQKLKLNFTCIVSNLGTLLEAFKISKFTHFSLKTLIRESQTLASIAGFLKHMDRLESLKLSITTQTYFNNASKYFIEICQQINKLEKLQDLKLAFIAQQAVPKQKRLGNFLPNIYPTFKKSIKLKALSISCNQLGHSEAFPGLITALQGLYTSLHKLKIDLGIPSWSLNSHRVAVHLIENLPNIRVLHLSCLAFNTNENLDLIIEAALERRNLEVFNIGEIHKNVEMPKFLRTIEKLVCKRGFRKFYCKLTGGLRKKLPMEINSSKEADYDMQKIIKSNPYLEGVHLSSYDHELNLINQICKWSTEEYRYYDAFTNFFTDYR